MNTPATIAKHFREVYFGGNWTTSNLQQHLKDVNWQQATTKVYDFNTIATLVNHIHYYVRVATKVLQGGPLEGKDELSFAHPSIQSQADWEAILSQTWSEAEAFAQLIEQLPEDILGADFGDPKYGSYYRNMHGIVEHTHYHLGQIVLIKKIIQAQNQA
jgi:uncharacterized damage-inducible protein DinB